MLGTGPEVPLFAGERSRGLSQPEKAYARRVFGTAIDYDAIVVVRGSPMSAGAPARTIGNSIYMQDSYFDGDSLDLTSAGIETLIHEMTHSWQYQTGGLSYIPDALWAQLIAWIKTGDRRGAYDWRAADRAGTPWEEWNAEQQAEAVEDYNKLLRKQEDGTITAAELTELATLQKYVDKMRAGPARSAAPAPTSP